MPTATSGNTVIFFQRSVVQYLGRLRVVYNDNGTHFKGAFDAKLKEQAVKHYFAPVSHPSSVGLAERYVRIVLEIFRSILQHHAGVIFEWDLLLPAIVKAVNTRMVRAFGYSPAQLLLGFQEDVLRSRMIDDKLTTILEEPSITALNAIDETMNIEEPNFTESGQTQGWRSIADINSQVRGDVRTWIKERTATKKRENHAKGMDSHEKD